MNRICIPILWLTACIVQHDSGRSEVPRWHVDSVPTVVIGVDAQVAGHELYRVVGATRLSDGRIAIANAGTSEIRFFHADGRLLSITGRDGSGPGEFRLIMDMVRGRGDTLIILSRSPGLTWIAPNGTVAREARIDYTTAHVRCMLFEQGVSPLVDGRLLVRYETTHGVSGCPAGGDRVTHDPGLVAIFDPEVGDLDTLVALPGTERNGRYYRAYGRLIVTASGPDVVYAAETGGDSVFAFGVQGQPLGAIPMPFEARPIPGVARSEPVRRFRRADGTYDIGDPYDYPNQYPRAGRLVADRDGLLWVMAYPGVTNPVSSWVFQSPMYFQLALADAMWRVLDTAGNIRAEVTSPSGMFPLEIGDTYILGLTKTELDVESVVVFSLNRVQGP